MALTVAVAAFVFAWGLPFRAGRPHAHAASLVGIHKIRHVVMIMQENRSFDSYFGTFPGADGLPRQNGRFTVCVPEQGRLADEIALGNSGLEIGAGQLGFLSTHAP